MIIIWISLIIISILLLIYSGKAYFTPTKPLKANYIVSFILSIVSLILFINGMEEYKRQELKDPVYRGNAIYLTYLLIGLFSVIISYVLVKN